MLDFKANIDVHVYVSKLSTSLRFVKYLREWFKFKFYV
jgi:hypothetical protein